MSDGEHHNAIAEAHVPDDAAHPQWFRAPNRRERLIAAGLFLGFGVFFVLLFVVNRGWWFRWIILALAVWSIGYAARHVLDTRRARQVRSSDAR